MNAPAARERRQRIEALVASDEWQLVAAGIARQKRAAMEALSFSASSEAEMRELQGRVRAFRDLLARPVEFLCQFDEMQGDE